MKKYAAFIILIIIFGILIGISLNNSEPDISVISPTPPASASATPSSSVCDKSLWDHVYNPKRLKIIDDCKTVTGTLEVIKVEKDGDYHLLLKLDQEYADLINDVNTSDQHGDLVLEPVCQNKVTQEDAINACKGFAQKMDVPKAGTHVEVSGSYVLDTAHGWMEIHPVSKITVIQNH